MTYDYDIFVSYRRKGNIPDWVQSVLVPELKRRLDDYLETEVKIALDVDVIETGEPWPESLSEKYALSKTFVMVLSANYFKSGWCMSEWRNALKRLAALKNANINHKPLVFPLRYNDFKEEDIDKLEDSLREEVRRFSRRDFREFTTLVNAQGDNDEALNFRSEVENLCESVLRHSIDQPPPLDPNWPKLPTDPLTSDDPRWRSIL